MEDITDSARREICASLLNIKLFYFAFYKSKIKTEPLNCNKSTIVSHFKKLFVLYIDLFNKTLSLLIMQVFSFM